MSLVIYVGDDRIWNVQVYKDAIPLDLTGMTHATFMVKTDVNDADAAALITKTLGAGIAIVNLVGGLLTVSLDAADTVLRPGSSMACCLQIKDVTGKTHKVFADGFNIVRPAVRVAI